MRTLTDSEKRTVRYAAVGITIYLALFGGIKVVKYFGHKRTEYRQLIATGRELKTESLPLVGKSGVTQNLMDEYHFDPGALSTNSLVADASAAIQKAAAGGGLQPGPIRETSGRPANKELASIQFETTGPVAAVMAFIGRLPTLGYPLVIDSVQISQDPTRPGQMKLNVTIIVLDFDEWKNQEASHA